MIVYFHVHLVRATEVQVRMYRCMHPYFLDRKVQYIFFVQYFTCTLYISHTSISLCVFLSWCKLFSISHMLDMAGHLPGAISISENH